MNSNLPALTTEKASNHYDDADFDAAAGEQISNVELLRALSHLLAPPVKPPDGMKSERFTEGKTYVQSKILHLQSRGIILHTN